MDEIYRYPRYYDIAFGYRDLKAEVDVLEDVFQRFTQQPVQSILELACGPAPHMLELLRRGYQYTGLDISTAMLHYAQEQAQNAGFDARWIHGDLTNYSLPSSYDAILTLLGSLYVKSTAELLQHLRCTAEALRPGGLYFLDWCIDFEPLLNKHQSWYETRDEVAVDVDYRTRIAQPAEQLFTEEITLYVTDRGKSLTIENTSLRRAIYPQEFRLALELVPQWEFVGWFNDWNIDQPLDACQRIDRPITILRRR